MTTNTADRTPATLNRGSTVVFFDTAPYRSSHWAEPRGHGQWAFAFKRNPDVGNDELLWSPSMTFGQAKKWARQQVKERCSGHAVLFVQP